jgi:ABC-type branched-subunit amino acid transport system ATPase component
MDEREKLGRKDEKDLKMVSFEKEPILKLQDVTKSFGNLTAVNHCSFEVEKDRIIGLIGPNGAGKTTLFNLITGSYTTDEGKILFKDQPITNLKPYQIAEKGIGKTFQITRVFSKMTLMENLIVAARVRNRDERALELLELAGLIDLKGDYASDLSYGQQKLLALIRVLMFDPDLILLDEPAAGINPTMQNKIMDLIHKLKDESKTFLIIEHDMEVIMEHSDKIVVLNFGEKIAEGTAEEIKGNEDVLKAYFGR